MSIDIKLQSLYKSLLDGEFLTKFDALSLSGVDLEPALVEEDSTPRGPVTLAGLTKLTEEIEKRLVSEGINEQGLLLRISNELQECDRAVQSNAVHKFMHSGERSAAVDWDNLPRAPDEEASDEERQRHMNGVYSRLQDLHAEIMNQLGTKCYVYKKVHGIYETYLNSITEMAANAGVRHASSRAKLVVDEQMHRVLSNKFLATGVLKASKQKTVQLMADLIFYGSEGIEYADHQLNFKSVLQLNARKTNFLDFGVSFRVGCVCMLLLWAAFEVVANELNGKETWLDPSFTIFICIGLFLVLLWCWGLNLYVWRTAGINFVKVLELDNTSLASVRRPEDLVFRSATDLTLVYLLVFISFNSAKTRVFASDANPWIAHSLPVALLLFFIYRAVTPWEQSRKVWFSMLTAMNRMNVTFRDGYVADILTSLVRVYLSIFFAFSYTIGLGYYAFSSEPGAISTVHLSEMDQAVRNNLWFRNLVLPLITLLPLKIRLVQCLLRAIETGNKWPHFGNALKYASALIVVSQGLFNREVQHEIGWLVSLFVVTMYQFVWDIVMDWGLIQLSRDGSFSIRSTRYIGSNWIYYVAVLVNFVLRFAWILTLIQLDVTNTEEGVGDRKDKYIFVFDYLHPVAAGLEIFRRMAWGVFRVEFEQIETVGNSSVSSAALGSGDGDRTQTDDIDGTPVSKFEKMEMSAMSDEAANERFISRSEPTLSDGFVEYVTAVLYEWVVFCLGCFGFAFPASDNSSVTIRKQRIIESIIFVVVLILFLSLSIFV